MSDRRALPSDEEWIASGDADRNSYGCWHDWLRYKREEIERRETEKDKAA